MFSHAARNPTDELSILPGREFQNAALATANGTSSAASHLKQVAVADDLPRTTASSN